MARGLYPLRGCKGHHKSCKWNSLFMVWSREFFSVSNLPLYIAIPRVKPAVSLIDQFRVPPCTKSQFFGIEQIRKKHSSSFHGINPYLAIFYITIPPTAYMASSLGLLGLVNATLHGTGGLFWFLVLIIGIFTGS
ncbi:hypothetical protein SAY86_017832 [Trapa natans]|uniref:Uncharacterized protein n=1 Tax=Trapa natans TaxID=22666 RepID=A0AAN7LL68_TRANT|nr:hypothetical protein SAY86_017832 [Trapa natans]